MVLEDPDFFYQMQDTILKGSSDFFDYGVKLLEVIMPIFEVCFGIYLLLWILNFWVNGSMVELGVSFVKKCIAWSIVIALAFNAGNYKKLADTTFNFSNELVEKVISTNSSTISVNGKKLHEMDTMKNKVYDAVMTAYDKGDEAYSGLKNSGKHLSFNIGIFLTHAILMVVIAIAFTLLLVSKVCVLLVIMVAPFFIGCLLFENTRTWGMNWINTVFGFVLNIFFYAAVIALLIKVVDNQVVKTINDSLTSDDKTVLLKNAFSLPMIVLLAAIVCVVTLNRIPQIATALTGGNIGGGGSTLGAAVDGIVGAGVTKVGRGAIGGAVGAGTSLAKMGWSKIRQGRVSGLVMFELDWIVIGVYGIVIAFTLWAFFRVWKIYGIFSIIAPLLSALGYGISSMGDRFEWSISWGFWLVTIVWTILWIFAFVGALTNGKLLTEEQEKQWQESRERQRQQQQYNWSHYWHHHSPVNPYSSYNRSRSK